MLVGLIGCVKTKRDRAAPARELYTSALFSGRRAAVEATCDGWYVLSALHGLVHPDEVLEPYDLALTDLPASARRTWSGDVLMQLRGVTGDLGVHRFEIHAGAAYTDHGLADGLRATGAEVVLPVRGLTLGQQLSWYAGCHADRPSAAVEERGRASTGTYGPLGAYLAGLTEDTLTLSFSELEALLSRALPPSARRHRAWWSNSGGSSQSRAWRIAGFEVDRVDQRGGRVRFRRRS